MNWSGGIQYQLGQTWVVEAKYSGAAGVKLISIANINQIRFDISRDPVVLDQISRATQNYKPYTQFGNINLESNLGHNTYHAGTFRVEKRFSQGPDDDRVLHLLESARRRRGLRLLQSRAR